MKNYQRIDVGLDMGTEFLINEVAYFLGGIIAADEFATIGRDTYRMAPVRHNKTYITSEELEEHFSLIRQGANKLTKETLMSDTYPPRRRSRRPPTGCPG